MKQKELLSTTSIDRLKKNLNHTSNPNNQKSNSWSDMYKEELRSFRNYLLDTVCEINGIKPNDIPRITDILGVPILRNTNGIFYQKSKIHWKGKDEKKSNISDKKSSDIRFLTYLLLSLNERMDDIIESVSKGDSYSIDYNNLKDIEKTVKIFIGCFMKGKPYTNILLRLISKVSYAMEGVNPKKYNKKLVRVIEDLKTGMVKPSVIENLMKTPVSISIPDDIGIDGVCKVSFMLRTGSIDFSQLVPFEKIEGATLDYSLEDIIEHLGRVVSDERTTIFYKAWENSKTKIKLPQECKNGYILEGIKTLKFFDFIVCDKNIHSFIDKMCEF